MKTSKKKIIHSKNPQQFELLDYDKANIEISIVSKN